ncbi:substrate-binding domain-containing protein [Methylorubrum extorquens]|uniref:substrate-binding domain-containing protein n=1 Tax=Methylorubrum extorquens TaxID=408 RepID=UPI000B0E6F90|nr:substrate-binding domain-containing protein [Methylorubrum extorquens]
MLGFEPGLTVIEQPVAEIGTQAMRSLYERIAHPGQPVRKVTLSGRAMLRASTRRGETAYRSVKAVSRLNKPVRRPSDRR